MKYTKNVSSEINQQLPVPTGCTTLLRIIIKLYLCYILDSLPIEGEQFTDAIMIYISFFIHDRSGNKPIL